MLQLSEVVFSASVSDSHQVSLAQESRFLAKSGDFTLRTPCEANGRAHGLGIPRLRGWFAARTSHFAQDDRGARFSWEMARFARWTGECARPPHENHCSATFISRLWATNAH